MAIESLFVEVDGMNTHYLEAGPEVALTIALLHSGEFGGCAEISCCRVLTARRSALSGRLSVIGCTDPINWYRT